MRAVRLLPALAEDLNAWRAACASPGDDALVGRWVHMLGFRGHFVTKSRGYSTTLGELRAARATYRANQNEPSEDDDSTVVLSAWEYIGSGYLNPGDAMLAAGIEASLQAAREALLDLRCAPP
ncbi:MAG: replication initiator [Solirubrobacteraceae bacterium]